MMLCIYFTSYRNVSLRAAWVTFDAPGWLVSFAAVIRDVTQCSSPTNRCSLELCIPFPLSLRTNNMHVTVSGCTNHISRYNLLPKVQVSNKWKPAPYWPTYGKECRARVSSSWRGTLRENPNNGCEGDYRLAG